MNVAYVGSGVAGSAIAMDKDVAKRLLRDAGLPIVPFLAIHAASQTSFKQAVKALGSSELFIKPANMGSTIGVSKTRDEQEFAAACSLAFKYDRKILIELCVSEPREIEISVLEDADGNLLTSELGEIAPAGKHGFYTYTAKYIDSSGAQLMAPASVTKSETDLFRKLATEAFRVLCCEGMARVDFFLANGKVFINEANTIPGFTSISMYPKLWEVSGLPQSELVNKLIAHALIRHKRKQSISVNR